MSDPSQANNADPGGNDGSQALDGGSPADGGKPSDGGTPTDGEQSPDGGKPSDGGQLKVDGDPGGSPGDYAPFEIDKTFGFTDEHQKTYGDFAKGQKFTQEQAQANVKFFETVMTEMADQAMADEKKAREGWKQASLADEEIGGDDFKEKHAAADQVMNSLGKPALDDKGNPIRHPETGKPMSDIGLIMEETGLGSHSAFIRLFYRLKDVLSEDTLAGMGGVNPVTPKTAAEVMFPEQGK